MLPKVRAARFENQRTGAIVRRGLRVQLSSRYRLSPPIKAIARFWDCYLPLRMCSSGRSPGLNNFGISRLLARRRHQRHRSRLELGVKQVLIHFAMFIADSAYFVALWPVPTNAGDSASMDVLACVSSVPSPLLNLRKANVDKTVNPPNTRNARCKPRNI